MMALYKNAFTYCTLVLAGVAIALIFIFGIPEFGRSFALPYLAQGALLLGLAVMGLLLFVLLRAMVKLHVARRLPRGSRLSIGLEAGIAALLLSAGGVLRLLIIRKVPMAMESDFLYYHDLATAMLDGRFQDMNLTYLALSPNGYGYPYVLSKVYAIFGSGERVALYFNMGCSLTTALFVYGIGRRCAGRLCGLLALAFAVLWPSQILYSDFNGTEALSTCILYGAALAYVLLLRPMREEDGFVRGWGGAVSYVLVGGLLALGAAVRPVATVFLIAGMLTLLTLRVRIQYAVISDVPLGARLMSKGYLRALLMLVGYMAISGMVNAHISQAIGIDIGNNTVTMGYSLATGVNLTSRGGYSEEVSRLLNETYEQTGSVEAAGEACMDAAMASIRTHPAETFNLFVDKFEAMWANDDYGASSNIHSLDVQGKLTPERDDFFIFWRKFGNVYYFAMLALSGLCLVDLWRARANALQVFVLFFVGAVALHLLIEVQNRYHYYILQTFALLAAGGITLQYAAARERVRQRDERTRVEALVTQELERRLLYPADKPNLEVHYLTRAQLAHQAAEGHVRAAVTEAFLGDRAEGDLIGLEGTDIVKGGEADASNPGA